MADGSAKVRILWADGEHDFRLGMRELRELQDKTGKGPHALYRRIAEGDWLVEDLRQTIRLGLAGGGMKAEEAAKLIRGYVDERPLLHSVAPALVILGACLSGPPGDEPGKKPAAGEKPAATGTQSPSPHLSEAPQPSE